MKVIDEFQKDLESMFGGMRDRSIESELTLRWVAAKLEVCRAEAKTRLLETEVRSLTKYATTLEDQIGFEKQEVPEKGGDPRKPGAST